MGDGSMGHRPGFSYWVSDEQLFAFARLPVEARLRWLEEMREFTMRVAPPEAQRHWRRLRGAANE